MKVYSCWALAVLIWGAMTATGQPADDGATSAEARALAEVVLDESAAKESERLEVPGSIGAISRSAKETVTLLAIDAATRKITLVHEDGQTETYTAGSGVANFDQLAVGDRVTVTFTEAMAVYLGAAAIPELVFAAGVVRAEGGAVPGGALLAQGQLTAKVAGLDREARRVTLLLPGEETREIEVAEGVDLVRVKEGDAVAIAMARSLEIDVEKP